MGKQESRSLLNNSRFYVLASSVLLSVATVAWLRLKIPSDQLFYIRSEQVFGLLAILYWYLALVVSPIGYVIGKKRMTYLEFARRAIGVSAAYFAVLHMVISLWGQLGGLDEIGFLPSLFKWSLLGGLIAVIILLIMAATSFDKVVSYMTYKRWKWLHRLGYFGGILAVLHIWTIGTHLAYPAVRLAAFIGLAVLTALETFRVTKLLIKKYKELGGKAYAVAIFVTIWALWLILIIGLPSLVSNYHTKHTHDAEHSESAGDGGGE